MFADKNTIFTKNQQLYCLQNFCYVFFSYEKHNPVSFMRKNLFLIYDILHIIYETNVKIEFLERKKMIHSPKMVQPD